MRRKAQGVAASSISRPSWHLTRPTSRERELGPRSRSPDARSRSAGSELPGILDLASGRRRSSAHSHRQPADLRANLQPATRTKRGRFAPWPRVHWWQGERYPGPAVLLQAARWLKDSRDEKTGGAARPARRPVRALSLPHHHELHQYLSEGPRSGQGDRRDAGRAALADAICTLSPLPVAFREPATRSIGRAIARCPPASA